MEERDSSWHALASIAGGFLFGAGWWCLIDGYGMGQRMGDAQSSATAGYGWLPLFFASLSYLMINGMKWSELRDDYDNTSTTTKARIFLLFSLLISMSSVIGAAFLMVNSFLSVSGAYTWAGISCLVGTLLIVLASFVQRFGTLPPK